MVLLFDAANTLIYKPLMYIKFVEVLANHGFIVDMSHFRRVHKIISECHYFPDRTSEDFYNAFNKEILFAIGIIPTQELLDEIFQACSYLPWEKFDDTKFIADNSGKRAVLSNFHNGLNQILNNLFGDEFFEIISSETENARKPDPLFFKLAINRINVEPSEIVYIGDSLKLDVEPALRAGMNAWLIDRDNNYPYYTRRLNSMRDIINI